MWLNILHIPKKLYILSWTQKFPPHSSNFCSVKLWSVQFYIWRLSNCRLVISAGWMEDVAANFSPDQSYKQTQYTKSSIRTLSLIHHVTLCYTVQFFSVCGAMCSQTGDVKDNCTANCNLNNIWGADWIIFPHWAYLHTIDIFGISFSFHSHDAIMDIALVGSTGNLFKSIPEARQAYRKSTCY